MRLQVKGKNVDVSDSLKDYAAQKLGKLDKHLNDAARLELELQVEKNPSIAENQVAEATVWTILFSRMVEEANQRSTAIEMTAAGIDVAKVRPARRPR